MVGRDIRFNENASGLWGIIGHMKLRYILTGAVAALVFGIFAVGQNSGTAQDLATKLLSADNANQSVTAPQKALADYVHSHMGASTQVFLGASYQRALAAANATPTTSGQVYHDAQAACYSRTSAVNQANCVQSYVNSHTTPGSTTLQPTQVSKTPYTFNYLSPHWTPDLAGILLLVGVAGLVIFGILALLRKPASR